MTRLSFLLIIALATTAARAQVEISADIIIPTPPPTAPLTAWHDADGRKAVAVTVEGVQLHGFRYIGTNLKAPEVLFFNGNGMTILRTDAFYRALAATGPTVNVYDYRGYGFTPGPPHLATFRTDGLALYDALLKQTPSHRVIVYGASMGTTVAAYVAHERPVTGLILGMPIASVEAEFPVYAALMGFPPEQIAAVKPSAEAHALFGEADLLKGSKVPLLVLGGGDDRIVPVQQARDIFAASASSQKHFVEVPNAGHNDVILSPQAIAAVTTFVQQLH